MTKNQKKSLTQSQKLKHAKRAYEIGDAPVAQELEVSEKTVARWRIDNGYRRDRSQCPQDSNSDPTAMSTVAATVGAASNKIYYTISVCIIEKAYGTSSFTPFETKVELTDPNKRPPEHILQSLSKALQQIVDDYPEMEPIRGEEDPVRIGRWIDTENIQDMFDPEVSDLDSIQELEGYVMSATLERISGWDTWDDYGSWDIIIKIKALD